MGKAGGRARIDGKVKGKAASALAEMGLSVSGTIRRLLVQAPQAAGGRLWQAASASTSTVG